MVHFFHVNWVRFKEGYFSNRICAKIIRYGLKMSELTWKWYTTTQLLSSVGTSTLFSASETSTKQRLFFFKPHSFQANEVDLRQIGGRSKMSSHCGVGNRKVVLRWNWFAARHGGRLLFSGLLYKFSLLNAALRCLWVCLKSISTLVNLNF